MSIPTAKTGQFVYTPEGPIAYEVWGNGPLVICVPGMGDLRSVYRFMAPILVNTGYRCGHDGSSRPWRQRRLYFQI